MATCIKCEIQEVTEEHSRCGHCELDHKAFAVKLDAERANRPPAPPRPEPRWIPAGVPGGKLYLE